MKAAIFVGPSVAPARVAEEIEARLLPPVQRGDIDALMASDDPPTHVGIADGRFLHYLAISPKEILVAMDRGVRFYGASSMGALRAVELEPYGMVGVGKIFELYRSGAVDADDEVAITFDPETLRPLSEPMVNMRLAVAAAVEAGAISRATADVFLDEAKSMYFPERTYRAVLYRIGGRVSPEEISAFERYLAAHAPDAKREDALEMARVMKADLSDMGSGLD